MFLGFPLDAALSKITLPVSASHFSFLYFRTTGINQSLNQCGTRWSSWLRYWARSKGVMCSIAGGVTGIFHWDNPSGRTMALGSTQSLLKISTNNIPWAVKAVGAQAWQPYHISVPIVLKSGNLILLETCGPAQACIRAALLCLLPQSARTLLFDR